MSTAAVVAEQDFHHHFYMEDETGSVKRFGMEQPNLQ